LNANNSEVTLRELIADAIFAQRLYKEDQLTDLFARAVAQNPSMDVDKVNGVCE
jgi:hypothetical protein